MLSAAGIAFLEKNNPLFVRKRRMQLISFRIQMFLLGLQYSIILPSALKYVERIGAKSSFFPMVVAGLPSATLVALPVIGRLYDKTRKAKQIIMVLNIMGVIGSLIYALPFSPWLPLLGRIIQGFPSTVFSVHQGEIAWITRPEQRLRTFASVSFGMFIGLFIGPGVTFVLQNVNVDIGLWHIDYRNSPGIFLVILWLLMLLITIFMTSNLANEYSDNECILQNESNRLVQEKDHIKDTQDDMPGIHLTKRNTGEGDRPTINNNATSNTGNGPSILESLREVLCVEILTVIFISFLGWMFLYETETLVPIVTQKDFSWSVVETNLLYPLVAVLSLFAYLLLVVLGNRIKETTILFVVMLVAGLAAAGLIVCSALEKTSIERKVIFILAIILSCVIEPLNNSGTKSLISKTTPPEMQGMMASYLMISMKFGQIGGPFYGTFVYENLLVSNLLGIELTVFACFFLLLVLRKLRYRRLKYCRNS